MMAGSADARSRPVGSIRRSSSYAPVSWKGISPSWIIATVRSAMSKMPTRNPASASFSEKRQADMAAATDDHARPAAA